MSMITTKYIELEPNDQNETHLKVSVGYQLGGENWWNSRSERRGYYLYCSPVTRKVHQLSNGKPYTTVTQTLGRGNKMLLKEVSRKSKRSKAEAISFAAEKESLLISLVCSSCGLTVKAPREETTA